MLPGTPTERRALARAPVPFLAHTRACAFTRIRARAFGRHRRAVGVRGGDAGAEQRRRGACGLARAAAADLTSLVEWQRVLLGRW